MPRRTLAFVLVLASALPGRPLPAQQAAPDEAAIAPDRPERPQGGVGIAGYELAENLRDRQVVNAIGEEVGEIAGLIISGDRVTHAVISIGGFVGLGGADVVVPYGLLRFDGDSVTIETLASADQIEQLTLFDPGEFGLSD